MDQAHPESPDIKLARNTSIVSPNGSKNAKIDEIAQLRANLPDFTKMYFRDAVEPSREDVLKYA